MDQESIESDEQLTREQESYETFLWKFTSINGYYTVPIISFFAFTLNLTALIILLNPKFKQKFEFKYIIIKISMEMVGSLAFTGFQNYFLSLFDTIFHAPHHLKTGNSFAFSIFRLFVYKYLIYVLYIWSGINEIKLTYDRYLIFKNKTNWFNKKGQFKYIFCATVSTCSVIHLPSLFAHKIVECQSEKNLYTLELTDFGHSQYYSFYMIIAIGLSNLCTLVVQVPLMIMVAIEYKRFIQKKIAIPSLQLTSFQKLMKKREYFKFNKMTLTLLIIFVLLRTLDIAVNLMYRILILTKTRYYYPFVYVDISLYVLISCYFCTNFFILFLFNRVFRKSFENIFLQSKIN